MPADRWDHKLVAFEMLKIWSTNSMLTMRETAWLALRDQDESLWFDEFEPAQKVAINAVVNFFNRLRLLTQSPQRIADEELVRALFQGDALFWRGQLDKVRAKPTKPEDVGLIKWYTGTIRPFIEELAGP
jgi:hypothetical protein